MTTIVGIPGSLRKDSYNLMLLHAAAALTPADVTLDVVSIRGIPLYDADLEAEQGIPGPVQDLKNRMAAADGVLIATPEYNNAMPGVLKNAIDWLSRPPADIPRLFRGLPVGIIGATPGMGGTLLSQASWLPVFRVLGVLPFFAGRVIVSGAAKIFDESGAIIDPGTTTRLREYVEPFSAFVQKHKRPRA